MHASALAVGAETDFERLPPPQAREPIEESEPRAGETGEVEVPAAVPTSGRVASKASDEPEGRSNPLPSSWAGELVGPTPTTSWRGDAARAGTGIALAAIYGLALGTRSGGVRFLTHAAGVPAALMAVIGVGVPALYITLALVDAPVEPRVVGRAAARALAASGLALAGMAPAAALFLVGNPDSVASFFLGAVGLAIGGLIGLRLFLGDVRAAMASASAKSPFRAGARTAAGFAFVGFTIFAVALAIRVWWALLPALRGAA